MEPILNSFSNFYTFFVPSQRSERDTKIQYATASAWGNLRNTLENVGLIFFGIASAVSLILEIKFAPIITISLFGIALVLKVHHRLIQKQAEEQLRRAEELKKLAETREKEYQERIKDYQTMLAFLKKAQDLANNFPTVDTIEKSNTKEELELRLKPIADFLENLKEIKNYSFSEFKLVTDKLPPKDSPNSENLYFIFAKIKCIQGALDCMSYNNGFISVKFFFIRNDFSSFKEMTKLEVLHWQTKVDNIKKYS